MKFEIELDDAGFTNPEVSLEERDGARCRDPSRHQDQGAAYRRIKTRVMTAWDNRPAYTWRLELADGSVVNQYDELGEEVLFGSVDLTRVREASWVPIRHLTGRKTQTVVLEPGQTPILRRRHRVIGDRDTVIMYILGARDEEGVLGESHINPEAAETIGGVLHYTRAP